MRVGENYEQIVNRLFALLTHLFLIQEVLHCIINKKNVINGKYLTQKHLHKKHYDKKRDFSQFLHVRICTIIKTFLLKKHLKKLEKLLLVMEMIAQLIVL